MFLIYINDVGIMLEGLTIKNLINNIKTWIRKERGSRPHCNIKFPMK